MTNDGSGKIARTGVDRCRAGLIERLAVIVAPGGLLVGDAIDPRYRDSLSSGPAALPAFVLRPKSSEEVSACLAACNAAGQPLVIQGGRTGFSGGERVCDGEAVLSLERMLRCEPADANAGMIVADAGVALHTVQQAADDAGLMFGVDIGARGSATIGGNVATNAGGIRVLRYGMFRAQILGLEAVLADGTILSSLKGLVKDNSGYDLNQLFVGSEGTLGVVTRAALRLHPKPQSEVAAFCALPSLTAAVALLERLRARLGPLLSACEVIFPDVYEGMLAQTGLQRPVAAHGAAYLLVDIQGFQPDQDHDGFADALMQACEDGIVTDITVSQSPRDFRALWDLREACSAHVTSLDRCVGCDVSLPLPDIDAFMDAAAAAVRAIDADARFLTFGHLGDGNLHYIVQTDHGDAVVAAVFGCVRDAGGSIAAEHGIGIDKKRWLPWRRSNAEIATMRRLKAALDPNLILNRGRIFDMPPQSSFQRV